MYCTSQPGMPCTFRSTGVCIWCNRYERDMDHTRMDQSMEYETYNDIDYFECPYPDCQPEVTGWDCYQWQEGPYDWKAGEQWYCDRCERYSTITEVETKITVTLGTNG